MNTDPCSPQRTPRAKLLDLFNRRVSRLERSGLAARMADSHYKLDYDKMVKGEWLAWDGVTEDAVDAFVLHVRLLTQDQDGFSIRRLAEDVYSDTRIAPALRERFAELRKKWQKYRVSATVLHHPHENRNLTNRELFETILYGGLAHANADKVELFDSLTQSGAFGSFVGAWFLSSLKTLLEVVKGIRDVNQELLKQCRC